MSKYMMYDPDDGIDLFEKYRSSGRQASLDTLDLDLSEDGFFNLYRSLAAVAMYTEANRISAFDDLEQDPVVEAAEVIEEMLVDGRQKEFRVLGRPFPAGTPDNVRTAEFLTCVMANLNHWAAINDGRSIDNPIIVVHYAETEEERRRTIGVALHWVDGFLAGMSRALKLDEDALVSSLREAIDRIRV